MQIKQWLGFNEDASQYALRPGELSRLNNLQSRRPGMLIARKGLKKVYGKYDDEPIFGIYRRATSLTSPLDFLWLQKVLVDKERTRQQITNGEPSQEYVWMVRRIYGNQSRVIATVPISPNGLTNIENFSVAEDRHGRVFVWFGHGYKPKIYRPNLFASVAEDMGLAPPLVKPSVLPSGEGYFIEGVDVRSSGGAYSSPPALTLVGGDPTRPALLKAIVQSGGVVGVDVIDGGANYSTPPTITVAQGGLGLGFRGKGIVSTTAKNIEGFSTEKAGDASGTAATGTQTYGETNTITNNGIMYRTQPQVATSKVVSCSTNLMIVSSVVGIAVGNIVTVYPKETPFSNSTVTVTAINTSTNTVTLSSSAFAPVAGTAYQASFASAAVVAVAPATYDTSTRRWLASLPLSSVSSGTGATALLEFSPKPLGYALTDANLSSIACTVTNWQKQQVGNTYPAYLATTLWSGQDYNVANSSENASYGGLQASGAKMQKGYSGAVNGRPADVYWPDYSKISVWFNTGTYSATTSLAQWTRVDVDVTTESGSKVLRFRLRPSQATRTIKSLGGTLLSTEYESWEQFPDAIAPEVKITLKDCPDTWVSAAGECIPTSVKEASSTRLPWWGSGTNVSRPLVDIVASGVPLTSSILITDVGSGWQKNATFAFRIYQANAYDQYIDYNTAASEASLPRPHLMKSVNQFVEYRLTANVADSNTPHGPPAVLVSPSQVEVPGKGYSSGAIGSLMLYSRELTAEMSTAVPSVSLSWTAAILEQLASATVNQIASVTIQSQGRGYQAAPVISVRGGGPGYGLSVTPKVLGGKIVSLQIDSAGQGYTSSPDLFTDSSDADLSPAMRPAMRGKYRCAYRFVDRAETIIKTITATLGETTTSLLLSSVDGLEPGMILESTLLPNNLTIKSISGLYVEVNQKAVGLPAATSVVVRDMRKPVGYSDFSPLVDVDAGPNETRTHSSIMTWSLTGVLPPSRADRVEFWRTSSDQSLVFYRCEAYGVPVNSGVTVVGVDTLTDEELFNLDRPYYAAMPVVLPNGNVNAYRFGSPRTDMAVAVPFQDRLWVAVSTSGENANTLYFSEYDEFESMPDTNEITIQINQKTTDVITALVPFGSMLLAMQHGLTYGLTYNTDPSVDAALQMVSHRGCLHQRCWDMHENTLFAADEYGIYSMDRSGQIAQLSMAVRDYFVSELIDFAKRETFFLHVDPRTHIMRFFCVLKTNVTETPSIALCYDVKAQSWWTESYPNGPTAACSGRPSQERVSTMLLGAVDGNLYEMDSDSDHSNESITGCVIAEGGMGYAEAPTITCPNSTGVVVQGVVSEGRLVDIIIQHAGWAASGGLLLAAESGAILLSQDLRELGGAEYLAIPLEISAPAEGGVQAVASADFAVVPRVVRECTVAVGESFVRLDVARTAQLQPTSLPQITAESGAEIMTQSSSVITIEPPPVEIGMEAIGNFLPLNAFVSHYDGKDIYLKHPDGTPALVTYGAARTNEAGTSETYLENGGTFMTVTFRKPFRTHIPFQMTTGYMQLVNDDVAKGGDRLIDRSITLVYTPTADSKTVELINRYNGQVEMRPNAMRRSRGGPASFVHREDSASTVLDIGRNASALGFSTGVAKAVFAGRASADLTGEDQHLQVELYARPEQASNWLRTNYWIPDETILAEQPFVMHTLTIEGVVVDSNAQ